MKELNEKLNSSKTLKIILAIAIPLIVCLLSLKLYGIRYQTNDDATLSNIAAGAYGDTLHMVYVNVLFSLLLRPLYAIKFANWYVIVQLVLVVVSIAVIIYILMEEMGTISGFLTGALLMVAFGGHIFYSFQYTECSAIMLSAGLLLIVHNLGKFNKWTWLGIFFSLMGSLVRWQSFYLVGAMSSFMLIYKFFCTDKNGKKNAVLTMVALFAVVFGAKAVDTFAYTMDEGWNNFREYNSARTRYSDFKVYQLDMEVNAFAPLGVSDIDYDMLNTWNFYDPEHFTADYVKEMADSVSGKGFIESLKDTLRTFLDMLSGKTYDYMFWLAVIYSFAHMRKNKGLVSLFGVCAVCGLLFFVLIYKGRLPSWVQMSLIWTYAVFVFYSSAKTAPEFSRNIAVALMIFAFMGYLCAPYYGQLFADSESYDEYEELEEHYFTDMNEDKEHLYLLSTQAISHAAGYDVWNPREEGFFSNMVAFGGWLSNAPHRNEALRNYGITRPIVDAVDNPNVYIDYHYIENTEKYASQETGKNVIAVSVGGNAFAPYQLVTENN